MRKNEGVFLAGLPDARIYPLARKRVEINTVFIALTVMLSVIFANLTTLINLIVR